MVRGQTPAQRRAIWTAWQEGLTIRFTLRHGLPPRRLLLVLDNLAGHKTPELVCWLMDPGLMPLYTPLGGSWLNRAESLQRIRVRRALAGQHPENADPIMSWLETVAQAWNAATRWEAPAPWPTGGLSRKGPTVYGPAQAK